MSQGKHNAADPATLGGRIQRVRVEMGMTQLQLARASGVNLKTIAYIEQSRAIGRWTSIVAIARALDVSLYYVVGERDGYGSFGE